VKNPNELVLFKNDRKSTDKHPDYKGTIDIEGDEFDLSVWVNKSQAGKMYMKGVWSKRKPKNQEAQTAARDPADDPDDIPF